MEKIHKFERAGLGKAPRRSQGSVIADVKRRMKLTNWLPRGNCFEAAVAAGILIANDEDRIVRLMEGDMRGCHHWWLEVDGEFVDPTAEQFRPCPTHDEYSAGSYHEMDLFNIACWLGLHKEIS